jgi:hypothetical protein
LLLIYYYAWDCGALCEVFHIVWQIVQPVQKKIGLCLAQSFPRRGQAASGEHFRYARYPEL